MRDDSMRMKCRIWWPKKLASPRPPQGEPTPRLVLLGWFVPCSACSNSVDIVVAFAFEEVALSRLNSSALEAAIQYVRERMPMSLKDKSTFSMLGQCVQNSSSAKNFQEIQISNGEICLHLNGNVVRSDSKDSAAKKYKQMGSGSSEVTTLQEKCNTLMEPLESRWIRLVYDSHEYSQGGIGWLPKLHYMLWNGEMTSKLDLHVIVYDTPRFGRHYFSSTIPSSKCTKDSAKRPKWINDLYRKQKNFDLDVTVLAINCSMAACTLFDEYLELERSSRQSSIVNNFVNFMGHLLAAVTATFSTMMYIVLQLLQSFFSFGLKFWTRVTLIRMFGYTGKNLYLRCSQILYWPIFFKRSWFRSPSSVEHAEKAALRAHSMLSSVAVDIILGNMVGFLLLYHSESACKWTSNLAIDITNNILRTGCVWLMGVPAGFKLNTELAEVLGMISLNAIQIWSTLWSSAIGVFSYIIKAVALSGIFFGITVMAALVMDLISIVSMHVFALHWLMSLVYSRQIQALTALWRLFRGRKWNPLRQRLDSYNYSVEQHVVGSLFFTPLLLLIPTTSIFYMFFTIMNTTIFFLRALIEVTIAIIHATPFNKVFLWLLRRQRFPSGFWFEIISCQNTLPASSAGFVDGETYTARWTVSQDQAGDEMGTPASFLHSNTLTLGQLLMPHYKDIFAGIYESPTVRPIYGVLTGESLPTTVGTALPSPMPWMSISLKEYWLICYGSLNSHFQR